MHGVLVIIAQTNRKYWLGLLAIGTCEHQIYGMTVMTHALSLIYVE